MARHRVEERRHRNLGELNRALDNHPFSDYLVFQATTAYDNARTSDEYGLHWAGPVGQINGATQQSGRPVGGGRAGRRAAGGNGECHPGRLSRRGDAAAGVESRLVRDRPAIVRPGPVDPRS